MGNLLSCPSRERPVADPPLPKELPKEESPVAVKEDTYYESCVKTWKSSWPLYAASSLEWYEYTVYGYVIIDITENFFPGNYVFAFVLGGTPMLFRPLGGLIFGYLFDVYGRTKVAKWTAGITMFSAAAQGILPSRYFMPQFSGFGLAMLVVLRAIQGIGLGGYPGISVWVIEASEARTIAMSTCMKSSLSCCVFAFSSYFCVFLNSVLSEHDMLVYGWRIPFILGIIPSVCALQMLHKARDDYTVEERPHDEPTNHSAVASAAGTHFINVCKEFPVNLLLSMSATLGSLATGLVGGSFSATTMTLYLGIPKSSALAIVGLSNIFCLPSNFSASYLIDKYGLGKGNIFGGALLLVGTVPLVMFGSQYYGSTTMALLTYGILIPTLTTITTIDSNALTAQAFPERVRASGCVISCNTTQMVYAMIPALTLHMMGDNMLVPAYICAGINGFRLVVACVTYQMNKTKSLKLNYMLDEPY